MKNFPPLLASAILLLASFDAARADVKLPAIFGDHMELQQEAALPVWGWADPGEKVTVTFGANHAETTGPEGKWRVSLPPVALVGDVWICSGQSNMVWGLNGNVGYNLAKITEGQLRFFEVLPRLGIEPCEELKGTWKVCTAESAVGFSIVCGLFGGNLYPVAVRYAWADNQVRNLYNQEGLPASPLRTDDWKPELASK